MVANPIILGISEAITSGFPKIKIYDEEIKQDLKPPCFFIARIDKSQKHEVGIRYQDNNTFDIHYFPKEKELVPRNECMEVEEKLYDLMELITVDGTLIRGSNMDSKIVDDVLHFFVDYNFHLFKVPVEETEPMETIKQTITLKEQ